MASTWDKFFERTALALKEVFGRGSSKGYLRLPNVIRNAAGKDIGEWEA